MDSKTVLIVAVGKGLDGDDAARLHRAVLPALVTRAVGEPRTFVIAVDSEIAEPADVDELLNRMQLAVTEWATP